MVDGTSMPAMGVQDVEAGCTGGVGVAVQGLRRVFEGGVAAIEGLDLTLAAGDFVALLGPSGCGKSTLLRLIAGLDRPTSGGITLNRCDVCPGTGCEPRAAIAYVFQDAHLLPWRSVLGNVALPLELQHVARAARVETARRAIEQVGLSDAARRYPAQLSGGMRMRVSLARALVTQPKLLLLDEPFAALDELTRQRLDEQLRELWLQRGMTVVFVTHSTAEAAFLANRAVVFSRRPARTVLDRRLHLPRERAASLRTAPQYVEEMRALYEALAEGSA
jgi:NitT/TauT family transport system ATP-binding protein